MLGNCEAYGTEKGKLGSMWLRRWKWRRNHKLIIEWNTHTQREKHWRNFSREFTRNNTHKFEPTIPRWRTWTIWQCGGVRPGFLYWSWLVWNEKQVCTQRAPAPESSKSTHRSCVQNRSLTHSLTIIYISVYYTVRYRGWSNEISDTTLKFSKHHWVSLCAGYSCDASRHAQHHVNKPST